MISRSLWIIAFMLITNSAHASMDAEIDLSATNRVMEMIVDLGGQDSIKNNGKIVPCYYRGTRKVSIKRNDETTTYSGEYLNCRENGSIRDGIYTIVAEGENIIDSTSRRSINGELFDAAIAADAVKVRKLIIAKADVNYTESIHTQDGSYIDEWSILMTSAAIGNLEIMKLLVAGGAWVNYMNSRAVNALWIAANNGRLEMVKFLTAKHAYINNLNIDDVSPLMAAAMNGHDDVAQYLVGLKADLDPCDRHGDNALMLAVQNGHTVIARLLITSGAELNNRSKSGATVLMTAVVEGNEEIVRLLIDKKADMTIKSDSGKTALDYAILKGNTAIMDVMKKSSR